MKVFSKEEILKVVDRKDLIRKIAVGFRLYSEGKVVVPPVGHMHFETPPGDLHIKYGYIPNDPYYVVKIATHFAENAKHDLESIQGAILVGSQKTGVPVALLNDEGMLSHLRTAAAGALCAQLCMPPRLSCIGIVGAGRQAYEQLIMHKEVVSCRSAIVWARNRDAFSKLENMLEGSGYSLIYMPDIDEVCRRAQLIVTCTPATSFLIRADSIRPGTHITCLGADRPGKQEIDPLAFAKADLVVVDSREQCRLYGDSSYALKKKLIHEESVLELGELVGKAIVRDDKMITIADLTGVAVQDIVIAEAVLEKLLEIN